MQKAKVIQLFRLFACTEDIRPWEDLADAAICSVNAQMKPGADPDDVRLCWYAAALANLQYRRMIAANAATPTYAGTAGSQRCAEGECALAERFAAAYRNDAADLLKDEAFVFQRV